MTGAHPRSKISMIEIRALATRCYPYPRSRTLADELRTALAGQPVPGRRSAAISSRINLVGGTGRCVDLANVGYRGRVAPNFPHIVVVPADRTDAGGSIEAHRRYSSLLTRRWRAVSALKFPGNFIGFGLGHVNLQSKLLL
jgi:hypothetical protein